MSYVPGRIEFLGKHTDYCGGESLVCPIDRGFYFDFAPRNDESLSIASLDSGETAVIRFDDPKPRSGWANYACEVVRRLRSNFGRELCTGVSIEFRSDLPPAAGLSSSSALMIMVVSALAEINQLRESDIYRHNINDDLDLAEYLGCIENGQSFRGLAGAAGVGTFGGSQDHAAIIAGRNDSLSRFAFGPLRFISGLRLPDDLRFVVASSGVVAEKTGAARETYNRLSRMVSEICGAFGQRRTLARLIDEIGIDDLEAQIRNREFSFRPDDLIRRVRQFYEESFEIIPAVATLIETGKIDDIGEIIDRSHINAESLLGNQVAETVFLQRSARELGAVAASAFGAGFGGSVYSLVKASDAERFQSDWRDRYRSGFPHRIPDMFVTRPSRDS